VAWVEVKNVTYVEGATALFPDAVTDRGRRHLADLTRVIAAGQRGILVFVIQRQDAQRVGPADIIDPAYGQALRQAQAAGVEVLAYQAQVTTTCIHLRDPLPVAI
jgi:sugar fermentation stimulation protein A